MSESRTNYFPLLDLLRLTYKTDGWYANIKTNYFFMLRFDKITRYRWLAWLDWHGWTGWLPTSKLH